MKADDTILDTVRVMVIHVLLLFINFLDSYPPSGMSLTQNNTFSIKLGCVLIYGLYII